MKNWIKFLIILVLVAGIFRVSQILIKSNQNFVTYKKVDNKVISYNSTPEELSQINRPNPKEPVKSRKPSSISLETTQKNTFNWEAKVSKELLRFQDNNTKVIIEKLEQKKMTDNKEKRDVQKLIVTYLLGNNRQHSATVLVDTKSGKIIKAWNRTKHENFQKRSQGLTPTNI